MKVYKLSHKENVNRISFHVFYFSYDKFCKLQIKISSKPIIFEHKVNFLKYNFKLYQHIVLKNI